MIRYYCSDGKRIAQAGINRKLSKAYKDKHLFSMTLVVCECCKKYPAVDNDHTIAQARCKELHKTDLIWNRMNFVSSCRNCHKEWEQYKSGAFADHYNFADRMAFMSLYDPVKYNARLLSLLESRPDEFTISGINDKLISI